MSKSYKVGFEITGVSALLMHWDNIEGADRLKAWRQDPENKNLSVPGDDRSPAWAWQNYLYTDGDHVIMPSDNVMSALMYGGSKIFLKGKKTYKELTQSAVYMPDEHLKFTFDDNKQLSMAEVEGLKALPFAKQAEACEKMGFRLFCKRAQVGSKKHVRVRPRFNTWKVHGELEVIGSDLPFETLALIFEYAGRGGLCDWRPSTPKRPGPFGMFTSTIKQLK